MMALILLLLFLARQGDAFWLSKSSPWSGDLNVLEDLKRDTGLALDVNISIPGNNQDVNTDLDTGKIDFYILTNTGNVKEESVNVNEKTQSKIIPLCFDKEDNFERITVNATTNIANDRKVQPTFVSFNCPEISKKSPENDKGSLGGGAIAGIVIAAIGIPAIIISTLLYCLRKLNCPPFQIPREKTPLADDVKVEIEENQVEENQEDTPMIEIRKDQSVSYEAQNKASNENNNKTSSDTRPEAKMNGYRRSPSIVGARLNGKFSKEILNWKSFQIANKAIENKPMDEWNEDMSHNVVEGILRENLDEFINILCKSLNLPSEMETKLRGHLETIKVSKSTGDFPHSITYKKLVYKSLYGHVCAIEEENGTISIAYGIYNLQFKIADHEEGLTPTEINAIGMQYCKKSALQILKNKGIEMDINWDLSTIISEVIGVDTLY